MRIKPGQCRAFLALLAAGAVLLCARPAAAGEEGLPAMAVHQALYEFRLAAASLGAGVTAVRGRMYFEQDDTCDAWTTDRRFATEYQYSDGPADTESSRYVAFESKDLRQFSFSSEREENGETTEQLRGSIEIATDGSARAVYSRPDGLVYDLPPSYLLPMQHTEELVRRARAGEKFFGAVVFDGTDAKGMAEVGAFISAKLSAAEIKAIAGANRNIDAALLAPEAWHVRMALFPFSDGEEITPAYEMEMVLHDNGVVSHALIIYKDFSVEQKLTALAKLPSKKCN